MLADLGASVTKVEWPRRDGSREKEPVRKGPSRSSESISFTGHHAAKPSIPLDIEQKAARNQLLALVERHDVFIETFQPGYLERLGLGFAILKQKNPHLIHLSMTGFGQTGPRRDYRSCDLVASAFGGQMYVSGSPSGPPTQLYGCQSAYSASLSGAVAVLLAIRRCRLTGMGADIDLSIHEAVVSTLDHVMVRCFHDKVVSRRLGGHYWNNVFHIFPCRDGHIQLTPLYQWETLLEWMTAENLGGDLNDDAWKDETYRNEHIDHIIHVMEKWTLTHRTQELFESGQAMHFPWAPVCSPNDVRSSPQLAARQFFRSAEIKENGPIHARPGMPYRFRRGNLTKRHPAPLPDEHKWEFYGRESGLDNGGLRDPAMQGGKKDQILAGIRVLDFTRVLAGPYATRMLADFGAEVIKIQSSRTSTGAEANRTAYFSTWNRNKRSVTINMDHPEARNIILRLTALSDIVIENFSPRVLSNWNLSYDHLQDAKPGIIMASISAMGQTGPWRDFVGFGPTFHALSGLTYLSSPDKGSPSGPGHAYADTIIGLYAALGLLTALEHRDRTGEGQYIDISSYEAICTLLGPALSSDAEGDGRKGDHVPAESGIDDLPHGCFRCFGNDRWCVIALHDEEDWQGLCRAIGEKDWIHDRRFSSAGKRSRHRKELQRLIEEWTSRQTPEEAVRRLQEAGLAAGVVQSADDLAHDPHLRARNFFIELTHPILGMTISDRPPFRFANETLPSWRPAPLLGADNDYVFRQLLGFTQEDIQKGIAAGLIR